MGSYLTLPNMGSTDPKKIAAGNRQFIYQQGQDLINQSGVQAGQSEADRNAYLDSTNQLENQMMSGQGGYTPEEAAAITRDPTQMSQSLQDSQAKQDQAVSGLQTGLKSAVDPSQLRQSSGYRAKMDESLGGEGSYLKGAVQSMGENMGGAVVSEKSGLDTAVDRSKLGLSGDFSNKYLMSPEEQQRIVSGAGISAGLKDSQAVGDLERSAAAAGTDPMGVAAYRARMARQQAADAGDAMTQARIGASNAAAGRQQTNEAMRLGTEQDISSRQQQNVRDVTNTGIAAQKDFTQMGIGAQETLSQQEQQAATTEEQNRQAAEQYLTGAKLQSETTGGEAALQNTQLQTGQTQQQNQYTDTNQSNRATGVANTRINQQNTAINNQNQKAGMANQNAQSAYGRQIGAYGTQTQGINQAAGTSQQASQNPSGLDKALGAAAGVASAFLDDGAVIDQPTVATIGEQGPEAVVPVGQSNQTPWWKRLGQGPAGPSPNMDRASTAAQGMAQANNPYGAMATLGAGAVGSLMDRARQRKAMGNIQASLPGAAATIPPGPMPPPPPVSAPPPNNMAPSNQSPMAKGSIVTRPTVAMLGDKGPEAVVPLNNKPGNKVKPSMLFGRRAYGAAA